MTRPYEVLWSPLGLARLSEIRAYISLDNPFAAERLALRIVALVEALQLQPPLGRPVSGTSLRALVISGTPYSIFYRIRRRQLLISTIHHSAQHLRARN